MSGRRKRKGPSSTSSKSGKCSRGKSAPKESFTLREKLLLVSPVLGGFVLLVVMTMRSPQSESEEAIRRRVDEWEIEYALSESVAEELFEIEKDFHLSESFFSFNRSPTPEEVAAHERAIKLRLGTDDSSH